MSDNLTQTFAALGDLTRRGIVARLASGERLAVSALMGETEITLTGFLKHVGVLVDAGLVVREKEGRTVYCRLAPEPLANAAEWLAHTQAFWAERLDALAEILEEDACDPEDQRKPRTSARGSNARSKPRPKKSSKRGRNRT